MTPNIGLFWYFFTEVFEQFRYLFTGIFQAHTFILAPAVCARY